MLGRLFPIGQTLLKMVRTSSAIFDVFADYIFYNVTIHYPGKAKLSYRS